MSIVSSLSVLGRKPSTLTLSALFSHQLHDGRLGLLLLVVQISWHVVRHIFP